MRIRTIDVLRRQALTKCAFQYVGDQIKPVGSDCKRVEIAEAGDCNRSHRVAESYNVGVIRMDENETYTGPDTNRGAQHVAPNQKQTLYQESGTLFVVHLSVSYN